MMIKFGRSWITFIKFAKKNPSLVDLSLPKKMGNLICQLKNGCSTVWGDSFGQPENQENGRWHVNLPLFDQFQHASWHESIQWNHIGILRLVEFVLLCTGTLSWKHDYRKTKMTSWTSWKTRVLQGVEEGIREGIADLFWGVVSKSGGTYRWDWGNEIC